VLTALNHKEPDRTPICEMFVSPSFISNNRKGLSYMDFVDEVGFDVVAIPSRHLYKKVGKDLFIDDWGVTYNDSGEWQLTEIVNPITSLDDLARFQVPDYRADYRLEELRQAVARFKGKKAIAFFVRDAFSRPRKLMGMDNLLLSYLADEELAHAVTEMSVHYNISLALRAIEEGADIVFSADDYASNANTLMSPAVFRKFIAPGLKRIVHAVHERGAKYIKHSDGNLSGILDDILDTGIDGLHPLQQESGMDIREVKRRYGGRICVIGNVDCVRLLPEGTPEDVAAVTRRLIDDLAPGGSYMIASSNSIHSGVRYENLVAMVKTVTTYHGNGI